MSWGDAGTDALGGVGTGAAIGAMGGPVGIGIGAGAGLLAGLGKYFFIDKPNAAKKLALAAATTRFSPYTGLRGDVPDPLDPSKDPLQGAAAGAALVGNVQNQQRQQELTDAMIKQYKYGIPSQSPMVVLPASNNQNPYSALLGTPS